MNAPTTRKPGRFKGVLAGGAGVILLTGGMGTFALWGDSEALPGGQVTSGALDVTSGPETWTDISSDAETTAWNPAIDRLSPGDTIRMDQDLTIIATGKNLAGELTVDGLNGVEYGEYLDITLDVPLPFVRKTNDPSSPDYNTFAFATPAGTRTVPVSVTFAFDQDTPYQVAQDASLDLSPAAFLLTQVRAFSLTPSPNDKDGDGVSDDQELIDGTNPNDPYSWINDPAITIDHGGMTPIIDTFGVTDGNVKKGIDTDGDGLTDKREVRLSAVNGGPYEGNLNLLKRDTDGDGLNDYREVVEFGTDPTRKYSWAVMSGVTNPMGVTDRQYALGTDTDREGISDMFEVVLSASNGGPDFAGDLNWRNPDTDGDGASDFEEQQGGTDPTRKFSWGDSSGIVNYLGVSDAAVIAGRDTDRDGMWDDMEVRMSASNGGQYAGDLNPRDPDTDDDGLSDNEEWQAGTDPTRKFSWGDSSGIVDYLGVTDRAVVVGLDTDGDGLGDDIEVSLSKVNGGPFAGNLNPRDPDTDGDGLSDSAEFYADRDPTRYGA